MKKICFSLLIGLFIICGCSGGSDGGPAPTNPIVPGGTGMRAVGRYLDL